MQQDRATSAEGELFARLAATVYRSDEPDAVYAALTAAAVPAGTQLEVSGVRVMAASGATNIVWMDW